MTAPCSLTCALQLAVATMFVSACSGTRASPEAPVPTVVLAPPAAPRGARDGAVQESAPKRWSAAWKVVDAFHGAQEMFSTISAHCATTPGGVRCDGEAAFGPLASTRITSPTAVWGFVFLCGVGERGAFVCSHAASDRPQQGPPRLVDVASVTVHAAVHVDGSLSATTNRDSVGYADPRWKKVPAVTDATAVASSWYATYSCYLRRNGEAACVDHDVAATPTPLSGVTDGARIWQTDQSIWVLTKSGRLLGTKSRRAPVEEVAHSVIDFTPNAAAPGARAPEKDVLPSETAEVPCAVLAGGELVAGLERNWTLKPVQGAGATRSVFGGTDWICAKDMGGDVRCIRTEEP
jgi:hypothetical protein